MKKFFLLWLSILAQPWLVKLSTGKQEREQFSRALKIIKNAHAKLKADPLDIYAIYATEDELEEWVLSRRDAKSVLEKFKSRLNGMPVEYLNIHGVEFPTMIFAQPSLSRSSSPTQPPALSTPTNSQVPTSENNYLRDYSDNLYQFCASAMKAGVHPCIMRGISRATRELINFPFSVEHHRTLRFLLQLPRIWQGMGRTQDWVLKERVFPEFCAKYRVQLLARACLSGLSYCSRHTLVASNHETIIDVLMVPIYNAKKDDLLDYLIEYLLPHWNIDALKMHEFAGQEANMIKDTIVLRGNK